MEETIINTVVELAQQNPKTAAALAAVPLLQVGAGLLARAVKRSHSTWLHTALSWFASLPVAPRLPPPATK